ncbi:uncharacterized protein LOC6031405 [Culex quinquefasciatus]|uniref:uncharacterized protein LOC6031405 n=1 Tax=Culex quinquefasciatus TaxID=7176 RepID=UPI0018E2B30E|nr:uncharacterized protein LOC6031405 [Culex quinquefasciatus]
MKHFFKLLDPMAVMPFTLRCLSFFGLRGRHPWHFRVGMFLVLGLITVPKVVFGYRSRIDLIIRGVSELLFDALIDSRVIIFAFKRTEFERLITILRREFNKVNTLNSNSPLIKIVEISNRKIDKYCKRYVLYVMLAVSLFFWPPVAQSVTIWYHHQHDSNGTNLELVTIMEQEFYWLDIRGNTIHYIIYIVFALPSHHYSAAFFTLSGLIMYSSIKSITTLFEVVSTRLATLHELCNDELHQELAELVKMHIDSLRCIELLENISHLGIVIQIVDCIAIWILMFLSLNANFNLNSISLLVLLIVMTGETYTLCRLGTELSSASLAIADAIYSCHWIQMPVDVRRKLAFMMRMAQKRKGLTAANFYFVDVQQFANIAQRSYSIFIVLKDVI